MLLQQVAVYSAHIRRPTNDNLKLRSQSIWLDCNITAGQNTRWRMYCTCLPCAVVRQQRRVEQIRSLLTETQLHCNKRLALIGSTWSVTDGRIQFSRLLYELHPALSVQFKCSMDLLTEVTQEPLRSGSSPFSNH